MIMRLLILLGNTCGLLVLVRNGFLARSRGLSDLTLFINKWPRKKGVYFAKLHTAKMKKQHYCIRFTYVLL